MTSLRLDTPVQFLKGVGTRRAELLERLGINTLYDLILHLPHRYLDASNVVPIADVRVGEEVTCVGTVYRKGVLPTRRGLKVFQALLRDRSGILECSWPGQAFLDRTIKEGQLLLVTGPVRFYHGKQILPRELVILGDADNPATGQVIPVYPATEGLSAGMIRKLIRRHLESALPLMTDLLPGDLREGFGLPPLAEAVRSVHLPDTLLAAESGRRRIALDELLDLQLMLARARLSARKEREGIHFRLHRTLTSRLRESLPWPLTGDQRRAIKEILGDMQHPERMHRLLMGDVGTGKTVVALFAMLLALENDCQAAMMAPTELLAEQHHRTLLALLQPLGVGADLLLGKLTTADKKAAHKRLGSGEARIVVGTHALLQEEVLFHRLGLVVIDEQHRFGVEQRAALMAKGNAPDTLLLTATPIPRSLAMTRYGDLDLSLLRERPPGRGNIRTSVATLGQRQRVFDFVHEMALQGRQAYLVLPVIDQSEHADLRAAESMAVTLSAQWEDVSVGLIHGRLKAVEKDRVMSDFRDGKIRVLVATTVIEVGIDVPNATIIVIEHPERFGLAQLHQLRGRVGRGSGDSHCILLSNSAKTPARLRAFASTDDGFRIAELDLEERKQGDLLGARQSGGADFRAARLPEDTDLLSAARAYAQALLREDPLLAAREHLPLRQRMLLRYPRGELLFRIG